MAIQNEHQYQVTQSKLSELERDLANLEMNTSLSSERLRRAESQGIKVLIARLSSEMAEYDALKQQQTPITIGSIGELAVGLIKARIAAGMTQRELADKVQLQEPQIRHYEEEGYKSATLSRLIEIARALEIEFSYPVEFQKVRSRS